MQAVLRTAALVAFVTLPSAANAYCPGDDPMVPGTRPDYYSVPQEFVRAKFVVEAKVVGETWVGEDGKPKALKPPFHFGGDRPSSGIFDEYAGAYYDVDVTKTFKGKPPRRLRLFSENSTGRFFLNKGKSYLLFVTRGKFYPPINRGLTVDNCGNSDAVSKRSLLQQLERLSRR